MLYRPITTAAQLREALGPQAPSTTVNTIRDRLAAVDVRWLAGSNFWVLATAGADGSCDTTPRGEDSAGHVYVVDDRTVVLPERPGNRRGDSYKNILENGNIGVMFFIPGRDDTIRINGRAQLVSDAPFFKALAVGGVPPVLAIIVSVEEVFYHCVKAFQRSGLWRPETWQPDDAPSKREVVRALQECPVLAETG